MVRRRRGAHREFCSTFEAREERKGPAPKPGLEEASTLEKIWPPSYLVGPVYVSKGLCLIIFDLLIETS